MLPNILSKIEEWVKEKELLDDWRLNRFVDLMKTYQTGNWIYPGVIIRGLDVSKTEAYQLLDYLRDKGILQVNFEMYCHACNQFEGEIYETFSLIPEEINCERCASDLNPVDNAIVIYKVQAG